MTQAHSVERVPRHTARDDAALDLARQYVDASERRSGEIDEDGFTEEERIGGELLESIARAVGGELRDLDTTVLLGDEVNRFVLTPDARFLRVDTGKYFPVRGATVVRLEPDVRPVLDDIEAVLLEGESESTSPGVALIRRVRSQIESPDSSSGPASRG